METSNTQEDLENIVEHTLIQSQKRETAEYSNTQKFSPGKSISPEELQTVKSEIVDLKFESGDPLHKSAAPNEVLSTDLKCESKDEPVDRHDKSVIPYEIVMPHEILSTECEKSSENVLPRVCVKCGVRFKNHAELNEHTKICVADDQPVQSDAPAEIPVESENLENHEIVFPCGCMVCGERFENRDILDIHLKIPHLTHFVCCYRYFKSRSALANHTRAKHPNVNCGQEVFPAKNPPPTCSYCEEKFQFKYLLINHLKTHHSKEVCCLKCGQHFTNNQGLRSHEKSALSGDECRVPRKCRYCEERCKSEALMKDHMQTQHSEKLTCAACNKLFCSESALERHNNRLHSDITCKYCQELIESGALLKIHFNTHHPKNIACSVCSRQFRSESDLAKHDYRVHSDLKIKCKGCQELTESEALLENHLIARLPKNITCSVCNKSLRKCKYCQELVESEALLENHLIACHPRNVACLSCNKRFRFKKDLKKHDQRVHSNLNCPQ